MIVALCAGAACGQLSFVEATGDVGLADLKGPHCCFVDLNNDGRPDAVIGRNRVFLNTAEVSPRVRERLESEAADTPDEEAEAWKHGFGFVEVEASGLPMFRRGDIAVFADLDNDGNKDCVWTRYLDVQADNYEPPTEGPAKTAWLRGNGDGTFGKPVGTWRILEAITPATTAAVAIGDVNRDGRLDLYLGNWYVKYGAGLEGIPNQLLLQSDRQRITFIDAGDGFALAEAFDEELDAAGRPTYGVIILQDSESHHACLLDLNYGRRWNRYWSSSRVVGPDNTETLIFRDTAPSLGLDGDDHRSGAYPEWLKERAKDDPRFYRDDEKPFRANGNTFDAAVGDIDNDGDFDLFLAEITHAWAGLSSDRSRFLVCDQEVVDQAEPWVTRTVFRSPLALSVDRVPADTSVRGWNQGDIFCELADFDLDGRLDLLLCSSDYPDNQRLRIYRQQADGTFDDITSWVGVDHVGAGQPSLADIDGDGDLDIMVGQSFNRLRADQRAGREPRVRVYLNQAADKHLGNALVLRLVGDPSPLQNERPEDRLTAASRDALGAIVRVTATVGGKRVTQSRQLVGIGGHQGKQMDFAVHFGLGDAAVAERVEIEWPTRELVVTVLEGVEPGTHVIRQGETARQSE